MTVHSTDPPRPLALTYSAEAPTDRAIAQLFGSPAESVGGWATVFWDSLKSDDQDAIRAVGVQKSYESGTRLWLYGDQPTHTMVILSGLVKLTRDSIEGRELIFDLRGPGYLLGELGPIESMPRNATVTVVEDVEAIVLSSEAFRRLLIERGTVAYAVLAIVADKLRQATDRRLEAGVGDAQARLCGRLVEMASDAPIEPNGVIVIKSPLTQQELADWIGVSRDAVVLSLRRLRKLGWVETGRRTIRILDIEALRQNAVE